MKKTLIIFTLLLIGCTHQNKNPQTASEVKYSPQISEDSITEQDYNKVTVKLPLVAQKLYDLSMITPIEGINTNNLTFGIMDKCFGQTEIKFFNQNFSFMYIIVTPNSCSQGKWEGVTGDSKSMDGKGNLFYPTKLRMSLWNRENDIISFVIYHELIHQQQIQQSRFWGKTSITLENEAWDKTTNLFLKLLSPDVQALVAKKVKEEKAFNESDKVVFEKRNSSWIKESLGEKDFDIKLQIFGYLVYKENYLRRIGISDNIIIE